MLLTSQENGLFSFSILKEEKSVALEDLLEYRMIKKRII
jgi:hypothetical protein